jgi:hypothetical protein
VKDGIPHHGVYPIVSFQFGSQRTKISFEGHQGVRRYVRILWDKVAKSHLGTCIGAARATLGRQVLEAYFLAPLRLILARLRRSVVRLVVKDAVPHHGVYPIVLISIRVATFQN